jgi:hypothetical protein
MGDEVNLLQQDCAYSPPRKDPYHGNGGVDAVRQKGRCNWRNLRHQPKTAS